MNPASLEPREWHPTMLVVVDEDENLIFRGKAVVQFAPLDDGQGFAEVKGEVSVPPVRVVAMQDARLINFGWNGPNQWAYTNFVGFFLFGLAVDGRRYCWCFNRAADFYFGGAIEPGWALTKFLDAPEGLPFR